MVERQARGRKVSGSSPDRSGGIIFFSSQLSVLTFISVSVPPPVLPQQRVKDPGHSAKALFLKMSVNVVFVMSCLYSAVSLTRIREWRFIRMTCY